MNRLVKCTLAILAAWALEIASGSFCINCDGGETEVKWLYDINKPTVDYMRLNNTVVIDYHINNTLYNNAAVEMFVGRGPDNCTTNLTDGITLNKVDELGRHVFHYDPKILINNNEVFVSNYTYNKAEMAFCALYKLYNGPLSSNTSRIQNSLYNLFTIKFEMANDYGLDAFKVEPKLNEEVIANKDYNATGYLCDFHTREPIPSPVFMAGYNQGELLTVCVELSQAAKDDGLYIQAIDWFIWEREILLGGTPFHVQQYAFVNGVTANTLTMLDCPLFAVKCAFHSLLVSDFFINAGMVTGEGVATIAFGNETSPSRRLLGKIEMNKPRHLRHPQNEANQNQTVSYARSSALQRYRNRRELQETSVQRTGAREFGLEAYLNMKRDDAWKLKAAGSTGSSGMTVLSVMGALLTAAMFI